MPTDEQSVGEAAMARIISGATSAAAIDLSVGEPDMPTPPAIVAAGVAALQSGATKYTPRVGYASLRELIVAKLEARNGYSVSADDVIVTGGGTTAVAIAIGATCAAGDAILIPDPGWPNYEVFASHFGIETRHYRQDPTAADAFDIDELAALVDERTRMIVINSPSNPTGGVASAELVRELVALAERHDLIICSDEAYEAIAYERAPLSPAAAGAAARTFGCYTLSKTYAMTGWRIGYVVVPPRLFDAALRLQVTLSGCASASAQRAAETALAEDPPEVAAALAAYRRRRDAAAAIAERHGLLAQRPAGGFYLWLDVGATGLSGAQFTDHMLQEHDVLVSAGEVYSASQRSRIRVSLATEESALVAGMERIGAAVERLSRRT